MKTKLLLSTAIVAAAFTSNAWAEISQTIDETTGLTNLTVTQKATDLQAGKYNEIKINSGVAYFNNWNYHNEDHIINANEFHLNGHFKTGVGDMADVLDAYNYSPNKDPNDKKLYIIQNGQYGYRNEQGIFQPLGPVNDVHRHLIEYDPDYYAPDYEGSRTDGVKTMEKPFQMGMTTINVANTFTAENSEFDIATATLIADKIDVTNTDITVGGFTHNTGNDVILAGKNYNAGKDYTKTHILTNEFNMNVTNGNPMGIGDDRVNFYIKDGVNVNISGGAGLSASAVVDKWDDWHRFIENNYTVSEAENYFNNYQIFRNIHDSATDVSNYNKWKEKIIKTYENDPAKAEQYIKMYESFRTKAGDKIKDFELTLETIPEYGNLTIEGGNINLSDNSLMLASNNITIAGGEVNLNGKSQIISLVFFDGPEDKYTFKDDSNSPFQDWGVLDGAYGNFYMTGGTLNINGNNQITGKDYVTIAGGTLNINEGATLSNVSLNGESFGNAGFMVTDSGVMNIKGTLNSVANIEGSSPVAVGNGGILKLSNNNAKIMSAVGVLNKGTLDIGSYTPTVTGPVIFGRGGTWGVKVNSATEHGVLNANVIFKDGASVTISTDKSMKVGDKWNNLTLINGKVAAENNDLSNGRFNVKLNNSGKFDVEYTQSARDRVAEAGGSASIGDAADAWDGLDIVGGGSASAIADLLKELSQYNAKGYVEALKTLAPSATPMVQQTQSETANQVFNAVGSRLSGGSTNSSQGMSSGDVLEDAAVWVQGLMNHAKLDKTAASDGFKSDTYGTALGLEKKLNNKAKAGIGYAYSKTDVKATGRDTDVKTHTALVYGEYKPSNWFVNGIMSYGWSDYDESKNVAGNIVKAKYDAETFGLQAMTGYDFFTKYATITPEMGLRYIHIKTDGYTDSASQSVSGNDSDIITGVIGSRVSKTFETPNGLRLTPEAKLAMTYDLKHDNVTANVTLPNGSSYSINGKALDRFGIEVGGGLTAEINDNVEMSLDYEGKFREDYQDHSGMINFKYNF